MAWLVTAPVQAFEVFVDGPGVFPFGSVSSLRDAVFQLQQAGQVGVLADFAFDRAGMQLQLAFAGFAEGADAIALADQKPAMPRPTIRAMTRGGSSN
jgi:hypothetical protein